MGSWVWTQDGLDCSGERQGFMKQVPALHGVTCPPGSTDPGAGGPKTRELTCAHSVPKKSQGKQVGGTFLFLDFSIGEVEAK